MLVIELEPNHVIGLSLLALVHFKTGQFNKAEEAANRAVSIRANIPEAKFILGEVAIQRNNPGNAEALLEEAIASEYFKKSAYFALARLAFSRSDWVNVERYAVLSRKTPNSVLESEDLDLDAAYVLGRMEEMRNDPVKAAEHYKSIQRARSNYEDVDQRLKNLSGDSEVDYIKEMQTARNDLFQELCEKVMDKLGFKVGKLELTSDGNLNLLARPSDEPQKQMAVFVRRNIELISDEQMDLLVRFMSASHSHEGVFISTGDFSPSVRAKAGKWLIRLVSRDQLEPVLASVMKK